MFFNLLLLFYFYFFYLLLQKYITFYFPTMIYLLMQKLSYFIFYTVFTLHASHFIHAVLTHPYLHTHINTSVLTHPYTPVQVTHVQQSFHDSAASLAQDLPLCARSFLSNILPPAVVTILINYGPERFSVVFTGEFDTPEVH